MQAVLASHRKNGTRQIAELHFVRTDETLGQAQRKRNWLQWEAEAVGTITSPNRAAKAGLTKAFR